MLQQWHTHGEGLHGSGTSLVQRRKIWHMLTKLSEPVDFKEKIIQNKEIVHKLNNKTKVYESNAIYQFVFKVNELNSTIK